MFGCGGMAFSEANLKPSVGVSPACPLYSVTAFVSINPRIVARNSAAVFTP